MIPGVDSRDARVSLYTIYEAAKASLGEKLGLKNVGVFGEF
jgi:hypothetical protein